MLSRYEGKLTVQSFAPMVERGLISGDALAGLEAKNLTGLELKTAVKGTLESNIAGAKTAATAART